MMRSWTLAQIAKIAGGTLRPPEASVRVRGISTNSRSIQPGELFIPLRGERFDGHDFLMEAARKGAAACLSEELLQGFPVPVVQVKDSLRALGDLGRAARDEFAGPLVAITGSSGKTTTKEMLASILATTGPGLKTAGNFNNLIGVPLTLLGLESHHSWAVIEMGMNRLGEIAALAAMARPKVGLITNIGTAHLEGLGGIAGVARAKGELFAGLSAGSTAVVNQDDAQVRVLPVPEGVSVTTYGLSAEAEIGAENLLADAGTGLGACYRFVLRLGEKKYPVRLNVAGRHNVHNAMAAAAAAWVLGVKAENIVHGLNRFSPPEGRMQLEQLAPELTLIDDTYNANPDSMRAALETLAESEKPGRRYAVLGDMLELGSDSDELHRQVGRIAAGCTDRLILMGAKSAQMAAGAKAQGMMESAMDEVETPEEAVRKLRKPLAQGGTVLVKGSRGMRMERICDLLRALFGKTIDEAGGH